MTRALFILLFLAWFFDLKAQNLSPAVADLNGARRIDLNKSYTFPLSPKGFGAILEFPENSQRSDYYFKKERNSIWLTMNIPFNGILSFEITPHSKMDDYDWMLFNYTSDLKDRIKKGDVKLLRSNNSRNDKMINGKTGIKDGYTASYENPGPGKSYSKSVEVRKGQKLALIIDNIYDLGAGFDFSSELKPQVFSARTLSGTVKEKSTQLPLSAFIVCEDDSTGVKLGSTKADKEGNYLLKIPADRPVNVTAKYPDYLFQTFDIKMEEKDVVQDFLLGQPGGGEKLLLYNIHFTPDKDLIKPNSEPELDRLIDLLKQQKDWNIKIIGHTNNNPFADARYLQKLSFNRAIAVKHYLIENGISEKRISCTGVGGKSPVVITKNAEEGLRNLRVEVEISKK